ncbi:hypothetical protein QTP81_14530 [Alteromonas sp. ASW11-36]|uniref:Uncharacterized protein n=1 Tax=Alteromonas arenosi TaxID=3055817 RepID=A0ABT7T049_9ALTE|nr:hypothetical protein [Alteromonas sp. ASW11-36]MDM7861816.1 hypothetical protein [Alteromonas sp. ASW11-36]
MALSEHKVVAQLLANNPQLVHSTDRKVISHVQREEDDWFVNTLMLADCEVPFVYRRKKPYQSLRGARINVTYYPETRCVAGIDFEQMKVVRLKRS